MVIKLLKKIKKTTLGSSAQIYLFVVSNASEFG